MEVLRAMPLAQAEGRLQIMKRTELQKLAKEAGTKVRSLFLHARESLRVRQFASCLTCQPALRRRIISTRYVL